MVKLIFLDIDGVICCNCSNHLEEAKLSLLKRIVDHTGAKVVLSTDWRRISWLKKQLVAVLRKEGMSVVGATAQRAAWNPVRPEEITAWLDGYARRSASEPVESFVAIDDRALLSEWGGERLQGHFVKTATAVGLTERSVALAIDILNGTVRVKKRQGQHGSEERRR